MSSLLSDINHIDSVEENSSPDRETAHFLTKLNKLGREIKAVQRPLAALSRQDYDQIRELAAQVAAETGQRFVDALPAEVRRKLSPSSLESWRQELAGQLELSLWGQLAWALNRAWWEARESGC